MEQHSAVHCCTSCFNSLISSFFCLYVGSSEDEPATQILTQNSLSESLEEIRLKIGQKQYLEAYYLLRNAEKQFPGAQDLR